MKLLPIVCFLLLPLCAPAQTIPIDSFYVPGATWTVIKQTGTSPCSHCNTWNDIAYQITVLSDTLVAGHTWHLLGMRQTTYFFRGNTFTNPAYSTTTGMGDTTIVRLGFVYTDSNRVWMHLDTNRYYATWSGCDYRPGNYMLFDYSKAIGDTLATTMPHTKKQVVDSITNITTSSGRPLPIYHTTDSFGRQNQYYYGIGHEQSLVDPCLMNNNCCEWYRYTTLCYQHPSFSVSFPGQPLTTDVLEAELFEHCFDLPMALTVPGVATDANNELNLLPNPTTGDFTITVSRPDDVAVIEVYNSIGNLQLHTNATGTSTPLRLHSAPGLYLVKITWKDGTVITRRLSKL
ncbi:MAG: T9SS C-terminal target domain-containing protein [Chitinophagia bacterium]|nr:T9SS C-terminal target domain-containing protein [Chitinophagia bacterium]